MVQTFLPKSTLRVFWSVQLWRLLDFVLFLTREGKGARAALWILTQCRSCAEARSCEGCVGVCVHVRERESGGIDSPSVDLALDDTASVDLALDGAASVDLALGVKSGVSVETHFDWWLFGCFDKNECVASYA